MFQIKKRETQQDKKVKERGFLEIQYSKPTRMILIQK
jgi:hypothetical protein